VKKFLNVFMLALAMNFLAVAGGVGYLVVTKKLDKDKIHAIKEIVFPPAEAAAPATQPTTQPSTSTPILQLDQLLAAQAGRPAAEQVQNIQRTFDASMAQLERRQHEVEKLQAAVEFAQARLKADREAFEKQKGALEQREAESARLAADNGFQSSLEVYGTMKPKQVKDVFAGLSDDVVVRYLKAMEPARASKILKEFKTPAELQRVKVLMEQVRLAEASPAPARQ
jgi:flagellar motility protein MotE (MotC chaperone)